MYKGQQLAVATDNMKLEGTFVIQLYFKKGATSTGWLSLFELLKVGYIGAGVTSGAGTGTSFLAFL
jgi:hypothetical protein